MRSHVQQFNPPPPGAQCSWKALPYCCCQDLLPEHNMNPRNPSAVNYQGDMALRREVWEKFPALRAKARKRGLVLNRSAKPGERPDRRRGDIPGPGHLRLLGESAKVVKGEKEGIITAILYLSPETEAYTKASLKKRPSSFRGLCPHATDQCAAACLGHASGQLAMPTARNARAWKTILYLTDRKLFEKLLISEIEDFKRKVIALGKEPAIRIDGSTDTGMAERIALHHPDVQFYDYTKDYGRMLKYLSGGFPSNWHLTYSYAGPDHLDKALDVLGHGGNVAVVFDADPYFCDPLPAFWHGFKVGDADEDDLRYLDDPGTVAGLRFKQAEGRKEALDEAEGFVTRVAETASVAGPVGSKVKAAKLASRLRRQGAVVRGVSREPDGYYVHFGKPEGVALIGAAEKFEGPFSKEEAKKKARAYRTLRGLRSWIKKKADGWYVYRLRPDPAAASRRKPSGNPFDPNPTKAEDLLEKAIRPCMTREEAHHAASSIERSLAAVRRHKVVPERVRGKIAKLASQARGSKTPKGRIRALSAANRMLQQLRTYGAGSRRPSRGYKRKRPEGTDPRLGHLLHGPALGEEAMARRRAFESEVQIAANPRTVAFLKRLIKDTRDELDDSIYFKRPAPVIAAIQKKVKDLEEELAQAERGLDSGIRESMRRTEHEIERDAWRFRHGRRANPPRLGPQYRHPVSPGENVYDDWPFKLHEVHSGQWSPTYALGSRLQAYGKAMASDEELEDALRSFEEAGMDAEAYQLQEFMKSVGVLSNPRIRSNPLLAIVGNPGPPGGREVDPRAFMARDRYRADLLEPGHQEAAEYWRGQAGAFFTANPGNPRGRKSELKRHRNEAMRLIHEAVTHRDFDALHEAHEHVREAYRCCSNPPDPNELGVLDGVLEEIAGAEGVLVEALYRSKARKPVAGSGKRSRVKKKGKVKKNFKAKSPGKFTAPRKKRYTLEEARKKFKGFDKAIKAYRRFHDRDPGHVDVYELDDGESAVTVDDVHAALHRTLETNYLVPWDSNKKGSYWKHEHIEGAMEGKIDLDKRIEDLPLEVFDVKRNRTIKLPNGRWYLTDWWREKGGRGERRRH